MVAVSPTPQGIHAVLGRKSDPGGRILGTVGRAITRIAWRLPGEYTIAKLDAYDRFRRQATSSQLLSTLLLSPVPSLLVNLLLESIPLAAPASGFRGSLTFQLRLFLTDVIVAAMPTLAKFECIPGLPNRSWRFALGYSLAVACAGVGCNSLLSVFVGVFPVPFCQFTPAVPMAIVGTTLNYFFLQTPETKDRAKKIDLWASMDAMPIAVYPVFTALFMSLEPRQQLWLSLLLPVLKHLLRQITWRVMRDELDLVGATLCTIGHLYHVLFTAMCLQNAKSLETLVMIIVVNRFHMLLNCRDILKDAKALDGSRKQLADLGVVVEADIVSAGVRLAQDKRVAGILHRKSPSRIFSNYPAYQGTKLVAKYHKLLGVSSTTPVDKTTPQEHDPCPKSQLIGRRVGAQPLSRPTTHLHFTQVLPFDGATSEESGQSVLPNSTACAQEAECIPPSGDWTQRRETFLQHVAASLHQGEVILLRSCITIYAIILYGTYLPIVFRLPNRKYFATMDTMTTATAVESMIRYLVLLGSMEVAFLGLYLVLISRRLGVSGVHQLAFVRWSQRTLLQSKFITLTLMILGFPLEHFGNGIIFRLRSGSG